MGPCSRRSAGRTSSQKETITEAGLPGSPNTSGYTFEGSYWPVENIDFTLAYTGFSHFNGSGVNYDGSGRNASDNNTVYTAVWFNY